MVYGEQSLTEIIMKQEYPIHPDFKRWANIHPPINKFALFFIQNGMNLLIRKEKSKKGLEVKHFKIPTSYGDIPAILYSPEVLGKNAPCLIYFHGGGFVFPAAPYHYALAREYAEETPCKVLFVNYHLAPKYPFPAAVTECYESYQWAINHSKELGIDPERLAVGGDSAGGQLAAVCSILARDNQIIHPVAQMLIYPAAGDVETESLRKYTDTPMCNSKDMEKYSRLYMSGPSQAPSFWASPIDARSDDLPSTYIETAEFDALRDGAILYGQKLEKSGVPVELFNTSGTMHGFDVVLDSPIVREAVRKRIEFLKRSFYGS